MAQANPSTTRLPELRTLCWLPRHIQNTFFFLFPFAKSLEVLGNVSCASTCGAEMRAQPGFGFAVTINKWRSFRNSPEGHGPASPSGAQLRQGPRRRQPWSCWGGKAQYSWLFSWCRTPMTMSRSVWGREETGSDVAGEEQPFPGELLLLKSPSGGTRGAWKRSPLRGPGLQGLGTTRTCSACVPHPPQRLLNSQQTFGCLKDVLGRSRTPPELF